MSIKESVENVKELIKDLVEKLTGGKKRRAAAKVAKAYGKGGQSFAAKEFGMGRNTIRKGLEETESGEEIPDRFNERGRMKATERLPNLEKDIRAIMDSQSQADPKFQTSRLYTNLSISELRKQLIIRNGYTDEELPVERTLNNIANGLKYTMKTVKKTKPMVKIPETELLFDNLSRLHEKASKDEKTVRLSIDTKDRVKIGRFSRGGKSRVEVEAYDHDFGGEYMMPFGIMDVKEKTVDISLSGTKVTADFMVDRLDEYWTAMGYSGSGKSLLLNADNGPENNSSRTQFIKRIVGFSAKHDAEVTLAYYPPYHSKYNPVERVWGVLEQHWNGSLLDREEAVVNYIRTMTYDQKPPNVRIVMKPYEKGVRVSNGDMEIYEDALERVAGLEKWFVRISPQKSRTVVEFMDLFS